MRRVEEEAGVRLGEAFPRSIIQFFDHLHKVPRGETRGQEAPQAVIGHEILLKSLLC